jgi:glycine/D-amino acid oxidase-like deaminating enzyme
MKVVIIGAGVIGSAIAANLSERGADVTVLSRERAGAATSLCSFAWYNALQKYPIEYIDMNVNGMRCHAQYAARFVSSPWYHKGGNVEWTVGGEHAEDQLKVMTDMQAFGYKGRLITAKELLALEPDIAPSALKDSQIVYYPDEGWIDVVLLVARLLADARGFGAKIVTGAEVTGFDAVGDRISAVRLADGSKVEADVVVNAAGPAADDIAAHVGHSVPMTQEPGTQVYTGPVAITIDRVIHAPGISMRPDGGGRVCLHNHGIDREIKKGAGIDDQIVKTASGYSFDVKAAGPMLKRAAAVYPGLTDPVVETARIALRPIPKDRHPIIGFGSSTSNLYTTVMHSGVSQCLWVGQIVGQEIISGKEVDYLKSFRLSRFAGRVVETVKVVHR